MCWPINLTDFYKLRFCVLHRTGSHKGVQRVLLLDVRRKRRHGHYNWSDNEGSHRKSDTLFRSDAFSTADGTAPTPKFSYAHCKFIIGGNFTILVASSCRYYIVRQFGDQKVQLKTELVHVHWKNKRVH